MVGTRFSQILRTRTGEEQRTTRSQRARGQTGTGVTIAVYVDRIKDLLSRGALAVVKVAQLRCRNVMQLGCKQRSCAGEAKVREVMPVYNLKTPYCQSAGS